MVTIPTSERYSDNYDGVSRYEGPCVVCGKDMRPGPRLRYVHVHYGGDTAILPEELAKAEAECPGGDLGMQPIGADCLARHPVLLPYAR